MNQNTDPCDDATDYDLGTRVVEGDRAAVDCLYHRYDHRLRLLLFRLCGRSHASAVEEILNEVWLTLWNKPPTDPRNVRAWLFAVTRTKHIDYLRRTKDSPGGITGEIEDKRLGVDELPEEEVLERRRNDMQDCLNELGEFKKPVQLWAECYSHDEIAEQVGIEKGTSYTRVHRGIAKVRDCMKRKGWDGVRKTT